MSRLRIPFLLAAAAGVVTMLVLAAGVLDAWPAGVRLALAFGALVLLPGEGWRRAIGAPAPGGALLGLGASLGYGIAWTGLAVLATRIMGLHFTVLADHGAIWTALPWFIAMFTAPRTPESFPALPRSATVAIVLAAVLAGVHLARLGTPVAYFTDSPDHIGTVRRMATSGDAFPTDAFFRDAGASGADPRKGLWHPCVALVCRISHVDPLPAWRGLAALLAPLFVLNAAAFAWWLGGPLAAAVGAWALLLTYGGGLGTQYLREAVFATKLADQLALGAAALMFVDLERRTRRTRIAAIALMLGTIVAHVFGAIQFAIAFGALGVGLTIRDRGLSPVVRRLAVTALAGVAVALPYLLWRAHQSYAPSNIIHTEPQGLLELAPGAVIVSYGVLWDWLGPAWVLFPCSLVAWWAARSRPAALYLLGVTVAVFTLLFVPPVVAVLQPRLGYLLMRFPWLLPTSAAVAFLVVTARDAWREQRRGVASLALGLVALVVLPLVRDALHAFAATDEVRHHEADVSVEQWGDGLAWMDRHLPEGTVVLSDPATCYSVPMLTRHWVTALVDQHSSPNDSLALDRILDSRDALDPYAPWARTAEVVRRWGATVIVVNGRWSRAPELDYWAPDADWAAAVEARLARAPQAFRCVWTHDRFSVWTIDRAALDTLSGGATPRPFVRPWATDDRARRLPGAVPLPALVSASFAEAELAHGDTLHGVCEWHVADPLRAGAYRVAVRFDRALPTNVPTAPSAVSKLWRKAIERVRNERYRFREDHLPVDGAYGVDRWSAGEVVQDSFRIVVPADVAAGEYTLKIAMTRDAHYPNLRLLDMTSDEDVLDGLPVGTLRVRATGGH